jgi:uncharacterized protein YecE (DUF72 family)
MSGVRIGCSGFSYPHWKGIFYPEKLAQKKWFQHYCSVFSSVELNVTFYRIPAPATFEKWYQETPRNFAFSLKGSRFITHVKRLLVTDESLDLFFNGAVRLKEKLKVVLWQFPPTLKINTDRLANFLEMLRGYPSRNALEFRHESWITSDVIEICKEHNTSLCMADWPAFIDNLPVTADVVYIRRHGENGNYDTCYSPAELKKDAKRIKRYVKSGKDVFIYFNNDACGYAPLNGKQLMDMLPGISGAGFLPGQ